MGCVVLRALDEERVPPRPPGCAPVLALIRPEAAATELHAQADAFAAAFSERITAGAKGR